MRAAQACIQRPYGARAEKGTNAAAAADAEADPDAAAAAANDETGAAV